MSFCVDDGQPIGWKSFPSWHQQSLAFPNLTLRQMSSSSISSRRMRLKSHEPNNLDRSAIFDSEWFLLYSKRLWTYEVFSCVVWQLHCVDCPCTLCWKNIHFCRDRSRFTMIAHKKTLTVLKKKSRPNRAWHPCPPALARECPWAADRASSSYFFLFFSAYSYFSYFLAISSFFSYFLAILLTTSKYLLEIWTF